MGSDHTGVSFHSESHWLSRGKVLSRVFELRDEIRIFLEEEVNELAHMFNDNNFLMKPAYPSDMFQKLNELNPQMQPTHTFHSWQTKSHHSQERDVGAASERGKWDSFEDSFESLKSFIEVNRLQNTVIPCMKTLLSALQNIFRCRILQNMTGSETHSVPHRALTSALQ